MGTNSSGQIETISTSLPSEYGYDFTASPSLLMKLGIQSMTMSDLILMDNTYTSKLEIRRKIIEDHPNEVIGYNPVAREAVHELYLWLFGTYLPKRFPTIFTLGFKNTVKNTATGDTIILDPVPEPQQCLMIMGQQVDCEFAIMIPEENPNAAPQRWEPTATPKESYHLHAFVLTFPSGFSTRKKLGMGLASIHAPVPGYSVKLEKSMDRYFAGMPFGKIIWRANWGISMDGVLLKLADHTNIAPGRMAPTHYDPTEEELNKWKEQSKAVDPNKCSLRMERQTLHRLERTGAIVFGFKTFLEPVSDIKKEGGGPVLAEALLGLGKGNTPASYYYKDGVIWGKPLAEYLTS
jgi:hypothetical protein